MASGLILQHGIWPLPITWHVWLDHVHIMAASLWSSSAAGTVVSCTRRGGCSWRCLPCTNWRSGANPTGASLRQS
ncbi:hypothetical protein HaLaN_21667 [Haematococcus lacustris]|uniref:Uncharacterized protein n=1 Tax=Haematococcus lacustris TaxID=44745 RepID=A0A6A0A2Z3_HAELA|nr:hypothetical protein HaLaN_21667 [Haematococcus lacustris]